MLQPAVWFAVFGALSIKLLDIVELMGVDKAKWPDFGQFAYWVPMLILPVLGGGLAYTYLMSGVELKPILAVNVGVSAPLILRGMFKAANREPPINPGPGA